MLVLKVSLFDVFENGEFQLSILMVILISILALILFGVGVYIVLQKRSDEEQPSNTIKNSGEFSIIRNSPLEAIREIKPSKEEVLAYLQAEHAELGADQREQLARAWESSIQSSVLAVENGDRNGYSTYSFELSPQDLKVCTFLHQDSYITREMIYNHPELLPPFYIGCTARLISREAWNNQDKSGWMPVLPVDGAFQVPDWRQVEI